MSRELAFFAVVEDGSGFPFGDGAYFFGGRKFVSFRESGSVVFFLKSNEVKQERPDFFLEKFEGKQERNLLRGSTGRCEIFIHFFLVAGFCKKEPIVAIARLLCWFQMAKKNLKSYRGPNRKVRIVFQSHHLSGGKC